MKFVLQAITTAALCLLLQFFLPWWTLAFGAAIAGFVFKNKNWVAFLAGFISVALLWTIVALIGDVQTGAILTEKINRLLPLNSFVFTALVGGIVGGFAGMSGAIASKL